MIIRLNMNRGLEYLATVYLAGWYFCQVVRAY